MNAVLIRVGLALVALVVAAWLVVAIRSLGAVEEGEALVKRAQDGPLPLAEVERARRELADARQFVVDGDSLLAEGSLLAAVGRPREADVLVRRLLASEPENDRGWFVALVTAPDAARARLVRRRIAELNPWAGEALR